MTAPVSRERIAELRARHRVCLIDGACGTCDLLATAEAYHDEHDRAERLAAEVDSPTYLRLAQIAAADRDAARAAHAALVASIETGLRESACAECDHDRCATYRSAASWVHDFVRRAALLDRRSSRDVRPDCPTRAGLPRLWRRRSMNPEDDPDLFQCSICDEWRSVDERHIGDGHTHPGDWCDACADGPGLWRLRTR